MLTGGSWALRTYTDLVMISSVMLGAGYASIFTALYVDWTKLRRMRNEWVKAGRPSAEKADAKARKVTAEKSTTKKVAVEETTTETASDEKSSDTES